MEGGGGPRDCHWYPRIFDGVNQTAFLRLNLAGCSPISVLRISAAFFFLLCGFLSPVLLLPYLRISAASVLWTYICYSIWFAPSWIGSCASCFPGICINDKVEEKKHCETRLTVNPNQCPLSAASGNTFYNLHNYVIYYMTCHACLYNI